MKAVLLIGGFGTRLRPLTLTTPKPLLPLLGRPFLTYQIDVLKSYGIRNIVLCTSYQPQAFRRHFGNGRKYGIRLSYIHETQPLGTGGAIQNARRFITGRTLICNGDVLMNFNLRALNAFHERRKAAVTIALTRVQNPSAYGLVLTDRTGRIKRFVEKPSPREATGDTINAGAYLFEPSVFDCIPRGVRSSVERDVFPDLLNKGWPLYAVLVPGYWLDMGTVEKYRQAHADVLNHRFPARIHASRRRGRVWLGQGVVLRPGVSIRGPVFIGDHATIGKNTHLIGPTVIGRHAHIGDNAMVRDSLLLDYVRIADHAELDGTTLGNGVTVGTHARLSSGTVFGDKTRVASYRRL